MDFTAVVKKSELQPSIHRDESQKQNIEWKTQLTEEYIQNDAIYMKLKTHKTK